MGLVREQVSFDQASGGAQDGRDSHMRYEDDKVTWAEQQAALLLARRLEDIDAGHIADEIVEVARREYDKLVSALALVLLHLLKWDFQPERRSRSWVLSVQEHRERIIWQLQDHPSLKSTIDQALIRAYRSACVAAARETRRPKSAFPATLPYSWTEIMERDIAMPGA